MIDKLTLRCEINDGIEVDYHDCGSISVRPRSDFLSLKNLDIPLQGEIAVDGSVSSLSHKWESIPSSFSSMGFKVFDFRDGKNPRFYVEITASPAKIMQGHNVTGTDDFNKCFLALVSLLYDTYPTLAGYLNHDSWLVADIDITYYSLADSDKSAEHFINYLQNVSYGHTKNRTGYNGTAYFGKTNSRLKKIKVYAKKAEVINFLKKPKVKDNEKIQNAHTSDILSLCSGMIRWEVTLKHLYLARRGLSCRASEFSKHSLKDLFNDATADIFNSLKDSTLEIKSNSEVLSLLNSSFGSGVSNATYKTFLLIDSLGITDAKKVVSHSTFYRHLKNLEKIGIGRSSLSNLSHKYNKYVPAKDFLDIIYN